MKESLKLRNGEMLYQWVERLSVALKMTEEQREAMEEVSKTSYIHGSQDTIKCSQNRNEL